MVQFLQIIRRFCLVAAALSLGGVHAADLPAAKTSGAVSYVTGGIGLDESSAFQAAAKQWPLTLEFAAKGRQPQAEFVAGVQVRISDSSGQVVLEATSEGPFLLARLEPGRYSVSATLDGEALTRQVVVPKAGGAKALFVWTAKAP